MSEHDGAFATDELDEKLYGLGEVAEQQQAMAQTLLTQLAEERAALAQERHRWVVTMEEVRDDVNAAALAAVTSNMTKLVTEASQAINELGQPVADQMAQAAASAKQAEQAFRRMIGWATARLLFWGLSALAGLVILGWLASGIVLWWDTRAIAVAHVTKQQLQTEVSELRSNRDAWVQAGMAEKLEHCGTKKRLCIAVDEAAGAFGEQSDHRIVKGF